MYGGQRVAVVVWLHNKIFYQVMGREKLFKGVM
jgi:hypothetical protein